MFESPKRLSLRLVEPYSRARRAASSKCCSTAFRSPCWRGARSGTVGARQMLYRADPYQIDIQIEAKSEGDRLIVTGQLLDVSTPGIVGRDVKITLSNHRGNVVHTISNQFGEFCGEVQNTGDLELSFPGQGDNPVVISLRIALRNFPGTKL